MPAATVINRTSNLWSGHKEGRKKSQMLVINRVRILGSGPFTPPNCSGSTPRGGRVGLLTINAVGKMCTKEGNTICSERDCGISIVIIKLIYYFRY